MSPLAVREKDDGGSAGIKPRDGNRLGPGRRKVWGVEFVIYGEVIHWDFAILGVSECLSRWSSVDVAVSHGPSCVTTLVTSLFPPSLHLSTSYLLNI